MADFGLTSAQISQVKTTIYKRFPQSTIHAFGSRINHSNLPNSDLDLLIISENPKPIDKLTLIQEIEDLDLPIIIDISVISTIDLSQNRNYQLIHDSAKEF